jgi:type IV pilus assembly protein PilA
MIDLALIGILAAVAIPAFMKYIRRSKTTEATMNIRKMYDSSVAYYEAEHSDPSGTILARQFPAPVSIVPTTPCCSGAGGKCVPSAVASQWKNATWTALNFSVDDPFYFSYLYQSTGTEKASTFQAFAHGDLDCDGVFSTYERSGSVDGNNNVTGGAGLYVVNDIE